jgi:hypothetical protein
VSYLRAACEAGESAKVKKLKRIICRYGKDDDGRGPSQDDYPKNKCPGGKKCFELKGDTFTYTTILQAMWNTSDWSETAIAILKDGLKLQHKP